MKLSEEEIKKIAVRRRIRQQAAAFLQRAKDAGIPQKFLRIGKDTFKNCLCSSYHKDVDKIVDLIYDSPDVIIKKPYFLIDGGDVFSRSCAIHALLFRFIACDKNGIYVSCRQMVHTLQDMKADGEISRNQYLYKVKNIDILSVGEITDSVFNVHLDTKSFVDDVIEHRYGYVKPTILSFEKPLCNENMFEANRVGTYLAALSSGEQSSNIVRIRVKKV